MTTAFLSTVRAIIDRLEAGPAVCDTVLEANDRRVPEGKSRAINVYHAGSKPQPVTIRGATIDWITGIVVECYAKTSNGDAPAVPLDDLIAGVYERLAPDFTLGGLVDDIGEPMIQIDYDSAGQRTGWAVMRYAVEHSTFNFKLS